MAVVTLGDSSIQKTAALAIFQTSPRPQIPASWTTINTAGDWEFGRILSNGRVDIHFVGGSTQLRSEIEIGMQVYFDSGGNSLVVAGPDAPGTTTPDDSEPYEFVPANSDEVTAFFNAISDGDSGTCTLKYPAAPTLAAVADRTQDQGDTFTLPAATGGAGTVVYSLTGATGVTIIPTSRLVTIAETAPIGSHTLTYSAQDEDGADYAVSVMFDLFIQSGIDPNAPFYRIRHRLPNGAITHLYDGQRTMYRVDQLESGTHGFSLQVTQNDLAGEYGPETTFVVESIQAISEITVTTTEDAATISYPDIADEYRVVITDVDTGTLNFRKIIEASMVRTRLDPGRYEVTVTPRRLTFGGGREDGPTSAPVSFQVGTVPGAPVGLVFTADPMRPNEGDLTFARVTGATGYNIRRVGPNPGDIEERFNTESTSGGNPTDPQRFGFEDLDLGVHTFTAAAENGTLASAFSASLSVTIMSANLMIPDPVTGLTLTINSVGRPRADWDDGPSTGDQAVHTYPVRFQMVPSSTPVTTYSAAGLGAGTLNGVALTTPVDYSYNRAFSDAETPRFSVPQGYGCRVSVRAANAAGDSAAAVASASHPISTSTTEVPGEPVFVADNFLFSVASRNASAIFEPSDQRLRVAFFFLRNTLGGRATGLRIRVSSNLTGEVLETFDRSISGTTTASSMFAVVPAQPNHSSAVNFHVSLTFFNDAGESGSFDGIIPRDA